MTTPSVEDSTSSRKSSSVRTRSAISRPLARIRSVLRTSSRVSTTATPTIEAPLSRWSRSTASTSTAGSPTRARVLMARPSTFTRGVPARTSAARSRDRGAAATASTPASRASATATSPMPCQTGSGCTRPTASMAAASAIRLSTATIAVAERRSARVDTVHSAPARPTAAAA